MRTLGLLFLTIIINILSFSAVASWQLNNERSKLNFISVKNEHISESHSFTMLNGSIDNSGAVTVSVDLKTVETLIPIRNERMQEHLFNTDKNPTASLSAQLSQEIMKMPKGSTKQVEIDAQISLNGKSQTYPLMLRVGRTTKGTFVATTLKPFIINAMAHDLVPGVDKLKQLAGLSSITLSVPVTFSVVFEQI